LENTIVYIVTKMSENSRIFNF